MDGTRRSKYDVCLAGGARFVGKQEALNREADIITRPNCLCPGCLAPCPDRPNCVCSRHDTPPRRRVAPFAVSGDAAAAFERVNVLLTGAPRTVIVAATEDYVHAACRTRLGFVDDLECRLCPAEGVIHVRSASRIGVYDFGANRARVEALRRRLQSG